MMIWTDGLIVSSEHVVISLLDRTFEHGLGLFETTRTWGRRAVLLDRHQRRMIASARELDLPIDASTFPGHEAVASLLDVMDHEGDHRLRITMSGGGPGTRSRLWMRADPINEPGGHEARLHDPVTIGLSWPVLPGDELTRHKTLNYWAKRRAFEDATRRGWGEALGTCPSGFVWEGSRTSVFIVRDGTLFVPPEDGPMLPGIMRGVVLERAEALGIASRRERIAVDALRRADEVFLTNSVRGIIPVGRLEARDYDAPGPLTRRLSEETMRWLIEHGDRRGRQ